MTQAANTAPPPDTLMELLAGLLAPLLMTSGATLAPSAARQIIAAYQPIGANQLITIAQLVGFALASLDSLRLSMPAELPVPMKLRLRGNANALDRASHRAAATLERGRDPTATAHGKHPPAATPGKHPRQNPVAPPGPGEAPRQARVPASMAAAPGQLHQARTGPLTEPATTPDNQRQHSLSWASAMAAVAAEYATELPQLPAAGRQDHLVRIDALSETARILSNRDTPLRSRLLGSTSLHG